MGLCNDSKLNGLNGGHYFYLLREAGDENEGLNTFKGMSSIMQADTLRNLVLN